MPNTINELKKLKHEVQPGAEWVVSTKALLLRQISVTSVGKQSLNPWNYFLAGLEVFRHRTLQPAVLMLVILASFLVSSLTLNSAYYSLPGDNLYTVKLALEQTHVAMMASDEKKVELKIERAEKRVEELEKIVRTSESDPQAKKKIETVVREFKNNVVAVNDEINKIKNDSGIQSPLDLEKNFQISPP